jgi:hypothetical protein
MSEYQYYEWQSVDRILTSAEQRAVNDLSSHIEVSSSRAVVTYNWSDFRHDPKDVLLKYFDAYFYWANWGSLRLMFRFPKGLLDGVDVEPYCIDDSITLKTIGKYQVLDLTFESEKGGGWMEGEAELSQFIQLRTDLLEGDYRLLYLAWLRVMTEYDLPDDGGEISEADEDDSTEIIDDDEEDEALISATEPPVPPGLRKLSPTLENFVQTFGIDPFLIQAAAENSPEPNKAPSVDYKELIGQLSREECGDFLTRLAEGDLGVGLALRKRLKTSLPREIQPPAKPRTFQELIWRAEQLEKAESKRLADAARKKHTAKMKDLAGRESQVWQQVDALLANGRKIASVYDEATTTLESLNELAEFQGSKESFHFHLSQLVEKYSSRTALMDRWEKHGWL